MSNAANDVPTAQPVAACRRNHLATAIIVTLYVPLLLTAVGLSVINLRLPVSAPPGAPALGNSAGHLLAETPAHSDSHAFGLTASERARPSWADSYTHEEGRARHVPA